MCRNPVRIVTSLYGVRGSSPIISLNVSGNTGMYTDGSCASGFSTLFPGPRAVYFLDLGQDTPLGGTLVLTTCGLTPDNTVIYVGTSCPTWSTPFSCRQGNDNAGDVAGRSCAANSRASTIVLPAAASRTYFVQVGGYGGGVVTSGLAWDYVVAASTTGTRSGSKSRTRSRTRSGSGTRSRKAKG
jgi:hypothetical protein